MSNDDRRNEIRRKIADDLNWRMDNASATARRLALAVAGIAWGVLVLNVGDKLVWQDWQRQAVLLGGALAIASLFADWLQSVMGYYSVNKDFDRVHAVEYDPDKEKAYEISLPYRISEWSFKAKHIFSPLSAISLLAGIIPSILGH